MNEHKYLDHANVSCNIMTGDIYCIIHGNLTSTHPLTVLDILSRCRKHGTHKWNSNESCIHGCIIVCKCRLIHHWLVLNWQLFV